MTPASTHRRQRRCINNDLEFRHGDRNSLLVAVADTDVHGLHAYDVGG